MQTIYRSPCSILHEYFPKTWRSVSVWSWSILPTPAWVFSRNFTFLLQTKNILGWLEIHSGCGEHEAVRLCNGLVICLGRTPPSAWRQLGDSPASPLCDPNMKMERSRRKKRWARVADVFWVFWIKTKHKGFKENRECGSFWGVFEQPKDVPF